MNQPISNESLPKAFSHRDTETKVYGLWENSGYFSPEKFQELKNSRKIQADKPFVMTLPPPNANGSLHLGHISGYTYQDIMGRFNRMSGRPTLLIPGKDHAGIQTEVLFEKVLEKKGLKKRDLGREEFYKQCYEFCLENAKTARKQEKNIGLSADFSREKFTLDPELSSVVFETFATLFKEGLVYRDKRIINWCVRCQTSLANIDTESQEAETTLYEIKYRIEDSQEYIIVATTRPETLLGDTAVAVNPKDTRYKQLIGKRCIVPIVDRLVPIISDRKIDKDFGTGAVKVTPAHSEVDFAISKGHKLPAIEVIDIYGKISGDVPEKYRGLKIIQARELLIKDLDELGLLKGQSKHQHSIRTCERCKSIIEPLLQFQWFVNVNQIKEDAINAVKDSKTKIVPTSQEKLYFRWLKNLEDWNISRQLWWGHQIPVWYCESKAYSDEHSFLEKVDHSPCGKAFIQIEGKPSQCPICFNKKIEQETDVFDTWFSSGQWPFSVLGGPGTEDYRKYYPTSTMETGFDILFFWVARMMLLGLYRTNQPPFDTVYLHGLVTDKEGKKMSKSKGNGVDPHEMLDKYGADAVRFAFVHSNSPAQSYKIYEEKIDSFRRFVNKIWNGSRFCILQFSDCTEDDFEKIISRSKADFKTSRYGKLLDWAVEVTKLMANHQYGLAGVKIYDFWWHQFADIFIEEIKKSLVGADSKTKIELLAELLSMLKVQLKVMHPFIPFVTEEIWQRLKEFDLLTDADQDLILVEEWPVNT